MVKVYRLRSGMSKVRLAKLSHLTPRIIHMIEQDPNYNPSRRTMIQLSTALGVPPSVLFFPQEEMDKRQMLSNLVLFCIEALNTDEKSILQKLQDMSLSRSPTLPPLVAGLRRAVAVVKTPAGFGVLPVPPPRPSRIGVEHLSAADSVERP